MDNQVWEGFIYAFPLLPRITTNMWKTVTKYRLVCVVFGVDLIRSSSVVQDTITLVFKLRNLGLIPANFQLEYLVIYHVQSVTYLVAAVVHVFS